MCNCVGPLPGKYAIVREPLPGFTDPIIRLWGTRPMPAGIFERSAVINELDCYRQ